LRKLWTKKPSKGRSKIGKCTVLIMGLIEEVTNDSSHIKKDLPSEATFIDGVKPSQSSLEDEG